MRPATSQGERYRAGVTASCEFRRCRWPRAPGGHVPVRARLGCMRQTTTRFAESRLRGDLLQNRLGRRGARNCRGGRRASTAADVPKPLAESELLENRFSDPGCGSSAGLPATRSACSGGTRPVSLSACRPSGGAAPAFWRRPTAAMRTARYSSTRITGRSGLVSRPDLARWQRSRATPPSACRR